MNQQQTSQQEADEQEVEEQEEEQEEEQKEEEEEVNQLVGNSSRQANGRLTAAKRRSLKVFTLSFQHTVGPVLSCQAWRSLFISRSLKDKTVATNILNLNYCKYVLPPVPWCTLVYLVHNAE